MGSEDLLDSITLFRHKAENGKLIIFVGAGVSRNVKGMPSWYRLIQEMAKAINYSKCAACRYKKNGCTDTCLLIEDYSADEFLKIPQYVHNRSSVLYNRVLAENISEIAVDAPLSSAIFDINPVHIITTNYDTLLESSKNVFCEQYQVIVHDRDLLNAEKSKYIIKMHGDISQPKTIVLKEQDYLDYSQKHVLIELFVKSLLTDHTLLFLGYSLNDYNIKLIISWLNYMRLQNDALQDGSRVGHIVLDDEQIDEMQISYFAGNNIGVINISDMPLISDIPDSLVEDKGKRLFSFLRTIADPSLEKGLASIEKSVRFMSQYAFVDYQQILKLLYIRKYEKVDTELRLFSESDYNQLEQFLNSGSAESAELKQLFINADILSIYFSHSGSDKQYIIGDYSENALLLDDLFDLYINNKYDELELSLKNSSNDPNRKFFYQSIVTGYSNILPNYANIDFTLLSLDQRVAYLHNMAAIDALKRFRFDSSRVSHYIENITSSRERDLFLPYLDIYNSNSKKRLDMKLSLEKLKIDVKERSTMHFGGTACSQIFKIKNQARAQYCFYYHNHIFYKGFSDANIFFKPYVEAIICANIEQADEPTRFAGIHFANRKYFVDFIDFDIITKFISVKELSTLLEEYKIKRFNTDNDTILFMANCFANLCNSFVCIQSYGFRNSSFSTLANLALLLNLVDLNEQCKGIIINAIVNLFNDDDADRLLFSTDCPDFRYCLTAISRLCGLLHFKSSTTIIKKIIGSEKFFEYAINVNFQSLRAFCCHFYVRRILKASKEKLQRLLKDWTHFRIRSLCYACS